MGGTVPLGRVAGVPVRAHWSLLVILALVTDVLATGVFPATVEHSTATSRWLVGALVAVGFLGSLFAHEVSHAIVARRHGVTVGGITLWMLGGVTQLEQAPSDPSSDLRIAIVGPLVSFACALVSLGAALAVRAAGASGVVVAGLAWLGISNGLLGVFNLLPGAPLDGGRVLRAWLWRRSGHQTRAALTAARVGRGTGMALVGVGVVDMLAASDFIGGLWLMIVGWFLVAAATAEMRATSTEQALGDVTVGEAMDQDLTWLPAYQLAAVAAERAMSDGRDACPVCDMDGKPVGVVAVDNLIGAAFRARDTARVSDVMLPLSARTRARAEERLSAAVLRAGGGAPFLVVDDGGAVVGIVTPQGTLRAMRRGLLMPSGSST